MTPIEQAARAICHDFGVDPDMVVTAEDDVRVGMGLRQPHPAWTRYISMARAAFTAVREPSDAMNEAGREVIRNVGAAESEEAFANDAANTWRFMIDALLSDKD